LQENRDMSKRKKTTRIIPIITWTNQQLMRKDIMATKDFKMGLCVLLEKILLMSDGYEGFSFQDNDDSEIDTCGYYSRIYN